MDAGFGFLIGSIVLAAWIGGFSYAFRYRVRLCSWLNAPDIPNTVQPNRKTILERRIIQGQWKIDDARAELEAIELTEN